MICVANLVLARKEGKTATPLVGIVRFGPFSPDCVEGGLGQIAKLLVLVRRCACLALLGQVSTARLCTERGCRSGEG